MQFTGIWTSVFVQLFIISCNGMACRATMIFCSHHEIGAPTIREIPDHATFRQKGINTGLVRQAWGMSLFGPMSFGQLWPPVMSKV